MAKSKKSKADAPEAPSKGSSKSEGGNDTRVSETFDPRVLDRTVIALPLFREIERVEREGKSAEKIPVIIDLNLEYAGGRLAARERVMKELLPRAVKAARAGEKVVRVAEFKSRLSRQYIFGELEPEVIRKLVSLDAKESSTVDPQGAVRGRAIFRIWPDFEFSRQTTAPAGATVAPAVVAGTGSGAAAVPQISRLSRGDAAATVKADAAQIAFNAVGEGVVWAVIDSGIDAKHPHFAKHQNVIDASDAPHESDDTLQPRDFTVLDPTKGKPLEDVYGHGTHVAGIVAGEIEEGDELENFAKPAALVARVRYRDEADKLQDDVQHYKAMRGMAPRCRLLSLKVLDATGKDSSVQGGGITASGRTSNIIAALEYIQEINGYGRRVRVHGVNLSVGYEFEPKWFACGQSPLCVEVDRLVKSGVVVVTAAGNTGYGLSQISQARSVGKGLDQSINDPGNAELAITVGSTHRDMPHVYGVSYFSSKGPTGDGREKPDLLAPGEKIISCDSGQHRATDPNLPPAEPATAYYREDSGTSMAAPHVSGVIAAFLSVRREFIGQPEKLKQIFCLTATDLRRARSFQGYGLVDLMRAIQSV